MGNVPLTNGPLAYLLKNRVYLGEINHRGQSFPGDHAPIIETPLFDAVQAVLSEKRRNLRRGKSEALLLGMIFDDSGNRMTPSHALKNGVRVRLRLVRATDRELLRRGFERLSAVSRYLRSSTEKTSLTERELTYLTDVDQQNHIAIGAVLVDDNGVEGEGVAVARLIRLPERADVAEAAVAVTDDLHGQGLGHVLLERLVEAGLERGIRRVRTEFLERNQTMREMAEHLGELVHIEKDSGVMAMEVELAANHGAQAGRLLRVLKLAAQGLIVVVLSPLLAAFGRRDE